MISGQHPRVSITQRLFAQTFALFVGLAVSLSLVLIVETLWSAQQNLRAELEIYQRSFEGSLAEAHWALDRQKLTPIIAGIIEIPAIKGVRLVDSEHGHEVIRAGIVPEIRDGASAPLMHRFELVHVSGLGRETIGEVEFYATFSEVFVRSQRKIILILLLGVLKTAALWWIFIAVGRRQLVAPLNEMVHAIDTAPAAQPMQLSARTTHAIAGTELGVLRTAYDQLVERVLASQAALEQANQALEQRVAERTQKLEEANQQLETLAQTDPLTGLANRRRFITEAQRLIAHAHRTQQPLALIVCDIDSFKQVNDTYGHSAGDRVIRLVASYLSEIVREDDIVGRFGGDEFVILLPDSTASDAMTVAQRLCEQARRMSTENTTTATPAFTLSCGVAELCDNDNHLDDIFQRADHCLYIAKDQGRDQAVMAQV